MKFLPLGALLVLLLSVVQARPSSAVYSEAVQDDDLREEPVVSVTPNHSLEIQSETRTLENEVLVPAQVQKGGSVEVDPNQDSADESEEESSSSEEDKTAIDLKADEPIDIEALLSEIEVRWGKKGGHGKKGHSHKKGHNKKKGHKKGHDQKKGHDHKKGHDKCTCKKESKKQHKHEHKNKHEDKKEDKKENKKGHKHTSNHKHKSKHDGGD